LHDQEARRTVGFGAEPNTPVNIPELYNRLEAIRQAREAEPEATPVALASLHPGEATWFALKRTVDELAGRAPQDHDVLMLVGDVAVLEVKFIEPHTFIFQGIDQEGQRTGIVVHYTQVQARVVARPKLGLSRVITGFAAMPSV
jgi:hypothetical protein